MRHFHAITTLWTKRDTSVSGAVLGTWRRQVTKLTASDASHAATPSVHLEPCSISGGPHEHFLQLALARKDAELSEAKQSALQLLLSLGFQTHVEAATSDAAGQAEGDLARERAVLRSVITLQRATKQKPWVSQVANAYLLHLERPAGHVLVPEEVGSACIVLQQQGYDAEAWWRGYYRTFVQRKLRPSLPASPQADEKGSGSEGRGGPTECHMHARAGAALDMDDVAYTTDVVPPMCWRPNLHNARSGAFGKRDTYATMMPRCADTLRELPDSVTGAAKTRWCSDEASCPFWIPLQLLVHLPFFPIPLPTPVSHGEEEVDPYTEDVETDTDDPNDAADLLSLHQTSLRRSGKTKSANHPSPLARKLSGTSKAMGANNSTTYPSRGNECFGWEHPFYDELFPSQTVAELGGRFEASAQGSSWVPSVWGREVRASFPLEAPWREVPLLSADDSAELMGVSGAHKSKQPSPPWPSLPVALGLDSGYQSAASSFWARKINLLHRLPLPYFFPVSALPFLQTRMYREQRVSDTHFHGPRIPPWAQSDNIAERINTEHIPHKQRAVAETHQVVAPRTSRSRSGGAKGLPLRHTSTTSPFDVLLPHWRSRSVSYFGKKYIAVSHTTLACLFDSSFCVQHAVPLAVTGSVCWPLLNVTRHRQQRLAACDASADVQMPESRCASFASTAALQCESLGDVEENWFKAPARVPEVVQGSTAKAPSTSAAAPPSSPWLARLHRVQQERQYSPWYKSTSANERMMVLRAQRQRARFLFCSPYWVEVEGLYARWGVHVAPGVVPLSVGQKTYVNAEQTTDASRFTSATCVPHLTQSILFCDTLLHCPWVMSQHLLSLHVPEVQAHRRGSRATVVWTYETLKGRAAAAQRVSNLWVAEEVVKWMGWTLRPVAIQVAAAQGKGLNSRTTHTIVHGVLPVQRLPSPQLRARLNEAAETADERRNASSPPTDHSALHLFGSPSAEPSLHSLQRHPPQASVTVFHSSCIVEEAQLPFIATYAPHVLLSRVPDLTKQEIDEAERKAREASKRELLKGVRRELNDAPQDARQEVEQCDQNNNTTEEATPVVSPPEKARLHATAARLKLFRHAACWSGAKLSLESRLNLARLALQKGYTAKSANRWVSLDFLRNELRVRPKSPVAQTSEGTPLPSFMTASGDASAKGLTAVDVVVYFTPAKESAEEAAHEYAHLLSRDEDANTGRFGRYASAHLTLVHWEELEWPEELSKLDQLMWLSQWM